MARKSATVAIDRPHWEEGLLVARCLHCFEHPGSSHFDDGSGVCPACKGSGWHVLAMEVDKGEVS